jgi:hypothetical protein
MKRTIIFWDVSNFLITLSGLAGEVAMFDFARFAKASMLFKSTEIKR